MGVVLVASLAAMHRGCIMENKHIELESDEFGHEAWDTVSHPPQRIDTQPVCFYPRYNQDPTALSGMPRPKGPGSLAAPPLTRTLCAEFSLGCCASTR